MPPSPSSRWRETGACPNCGKTTEHSACSKTTKRSTYWPKDAKCAQCAGFDEPQPCGGTSPQGDFVLYEGAKVELVKECGNLITCKDRSLKDGETLRDHLQKNHPELFTKEHQEMFQCRAAPVVDVKLEVLLEPIRKIVEAYQTAEEEREKLLKGFSYAGPTERKDYFTPITDLFDELANAYQQLDDDYWANVEKHNLDQLD